MKAPKREKRGFSFWWFIYISIFANTNMLNKKPHAEPEELWWKIFNCIKFGFVL